GPARRPYRDPLGLADQQVVGDDPAVEVVRLALLQGDQVPSATVVKEEDPLPRLEAAYRQLSTPTSRPPSRTTKRPAGFAATRATPHPSGPAGLAPPPPA